jgi:hypothetical protein
MCGETPKFVSARLTAATSVEAYDGKIISVSLTDNIAAKIVTKRSTGRLDTVKLDLSEARKLGAILLSL